jgi:hypothetical protein
MELLIPQNVLQSHFTIQFINALVGRMATGFAGIHHTVYNSKTWKNEAKLKVTLQ